MQNPQEQRALLLMQHGRWADAERELRGWLASEPQNARAHALLAMTQLELLRYTQATELAQRAVVLDPDQPLGYYVLAAVLRERNRFADALEPLQQAIRLDPYDPRHFALLAQIKLDQRNWPAALEAANRGLEIDPTNSTCVNLRGIALTRLNDRSAAAETIKGALERDPENDLTHANEGWRLLHANQPRQAMEHFRESLRLNPNNEWARAGIVEAMKARNPVYRLLLAYFLFMARKTAGMQWTIVIVGYIGFRLLRTFADDNPAVAPFVTPILYAYIVFALSTWLASTLMNMMLRFSRFGRYALSKEQIWTSNLVAILLLGCVTMISLGIWLDHDWLFTAGLMSGMLALPSAVLFTCSAGWPRWTGAGILVVLAVIGAAEVWQEWADPREGYVFETWQMFLWGILLSQFAMSYLVSAKPRR